MGRIPAPTRPVERHDRSCGPRNTGLAMTVKSFWRRRRRRRRRKVYSKLTEEEDEEEEEEEESLFKADAVNEEDSERDRATQV